MTIDHRRLIAALRDTALKATETVEVGAPDFAHDMSRPHFDRSLPTTRMETRDAFSKDWIAGRLLGMADTLEAMLIDQDEA